MRTLLNKQNIPNKQDLFFVDRVFSNLRFLGDDTMLKIHLVGAFHSEVNATAKRYIGKSFGPKTKNVITEQTHNEILSGQCNAIYQLVQCILYNNSTVIEEVPPWVNNLQLTSGTINKKYPAKPFAHDELRAFSSMVYQMPLLLDTEDEEKKFLCLLLSNLHLINTPKALREEVVKLVDFERLADKYPVNEPEIYYYPKILGKMGKVKRYCV